MILQEELAKYRRAKETLAKKEKKMALVKAAISDLEGMLMKRLKEEEEVQEGQLCAVIETSLGKAAIRWKDIVIDLKGKAFAEKKLQDAKRSPVEKLKVEVVH